MKHNEEFQKEKKCKITIYVDTGEYETDEYEFKCLLKDAPLKLQLLADKMKADYKIKRSQDPFNYY